MWNSNLFNSRCAQVSKAVGKSWVLSINLLSFNKYGGGRFKN